MLVQAILSGVSNESLIDSHVVIPTPLRDLLRNYNKIAMNDARLPVVTEQTTGAELKKAIAMLEPADQVALLHTYSQATRKFDEPVTSEDHSVTEERKLRAVMRKIIFLCLSTLGLMLVGSSITVAASLGYFKNFWTSQFVMTATEFMKFLFLVDKSSGE